MTNEEIWQAILAQIQLNVSPAAFITWFKSTRIEAIEMALLPYQLRAPL